MNMEREKGNAVYKHGLYDVGIATIFTTVGSSLIST